MNSRNQWIWAALGAVLLTAPKQAGHNREKLPSFRGVCEVQSSLPGRMRLKLAAIDPAQAEKARSQLLSTAVVTEVSFDQRLGTALILYDPAKAEGTVIEGAFLRLMGLDEAVSNKSMSRAEAGIRTLLEGIDFAIMERTNGWLDGSTLLSGTLAACGLYRMTKLGTGIPGAWTLLWWASSVFRRGGNV